MVGFVSAPAVAARILLDLERCGVEAHRQSRDQGPTATAAPAGVPWRGFPAPGGRPFLGLRPKGRSSRPVRPRLDSCRRTYFDNCLDRFMIRSEHLGVLSWHATPARGSTSAWGFPRSPGHSRGGAGCRSRVGSPGIPEFSSGTLPSCGFARSRALPRLFGRVPLEIGRHSPLPSISYHGGHGNPGAYCGSPTRHMVPQCGVFVSVHGGASGFTTWHLSAAAPPRFSGLRTAKPAGAFPVLESSVVLVWICCGPQHVVQKELQP